MVPPFGRCGPVNVIAINRRSPGSDHSDNPGTQETFRDNKLFGITMTLEPWFAAAISSQLMRNSGDLAATSLVIIQQKGRPKALWIARPTACRRLKLRL
jgi:hypothetical protein